MESHLIRKKMTQREVDLLFQDMEENRSSPIGAANNVDDSNDALANHILQQKLRNVNVGEKAKFIKTATDQNTRVHGVILQVNNLVMALSLDELQIQLQSYRMPSVNQNQNILANFDLQGAMDRLQNENIMPPPPPPLQKTPAAVTAPVGRKRNVEVIDDDISVVKKKKSAN